MNELNNVVLYHANCPDGAVAAMLLHMVDQSAKLHAVRYGEDFPWDKVDGPHNVFIVDFSYPKDVLEKLIKMGCMVTIFDHHKTTKEEYGILDDVVDYIGPGYSVHVDLKKSGASLVWSYIKDALDQDQPTHSGSYAIFRLLTKNNQRPEFHTKVIRERIDDLVKAVENRDLWKTPFDLYTKIYNQMIFMCRTDPEAIAKVILRYESKVFQEYFQDAKSRVEHTSEICKDIAKRSYRTKLCGYEAAVVNVAGSFVSEACQYVYEDPKYPQDIVAVGINISEKGISCSLRSKQDVGPDVSEIAKQFGGGGHKHAAGCILPHEALSKLYSGLL